MIHPEIYNYWTKQGYTVHQVRLTYFIYSGDKYITCIAYQEYSPYEMKYFKSIDYSSSLTEKEMLSYIRLRAFI